MNDNDATTLDTPEQDSDIDWTKEPATVREQRIRAVMLRHVFDKDGFALLELNALLGESRTPCFYPEKAASDFREAYAKADALRVQRTDETKKSRLERAIREVDDART